MAYEKTQNEEDDYSSIEEQEREELINPWALIGREKEEKEEVILLKNSSANLIHKIIKCKTNSNKIFLQFL